MGYYSNLAIDYISYDRDCSYTPPEKVLLWRLEDLQERLQELTVKQRTCRKRVSFSEEDLRYVLPEHFMTAADVEAAIELTIEALKDRYGIDIRQEDREDPVFDEVTDMQISIMDILRFSPGNSLLCVA